MSADVVAADEKVEKTYLRRLFEALGVKGLMVLVAVPASLGASGVFSEVSPAVFGGLLTAVFVAAVVIDSKRSPSSSIDAVGLSFVAVLAGHTVVLLTDLNFEWTYAVGAAGLVLGAVAYEYLSKGNASIGEVHGTDVDPLHLDIVGFVTAEILVVYAVLHSTGWETFADSPVFVVLAYVFYASTVAAFAGYAVITREIVISRASEEVHIAVISVLEDIQDIADERLRKRLALNIRRVAECLHGIRTPTKLEDQYGRVPAVLPSRDPDVRRIDLKVEDILKVADRSEFTGYVIHDDALFLFRGGDLSKYYEKGEYFGNADSILDKVADGSFYGLEYPTVKNLIDITPEEGEIGNPEKAMEEIEDKEVDERAKASQSLDIGGEEVDVKNMFSITEELVEESPKEDDDSGKLNVGGDEIDVEEIIERADDVIEDLSDE